MAKNVLVLGAGVVGVSTAWYLTQAGYQVTVVDRQPGPALETSFANGGQISTSHAQPWARPGVLPLIVRWLGQEDAPLLWRHRADPGQWLWGLRFLRETSPTRCKANTLAILRLALFSRACLGQLRAALDLHYEQLERGILYLYATKAGLNQAAEHIKLLAANGCACHVLSADECVQHEPALAAARAYLVGGTYAPADESGDAQLFTAALAAHCASCGVRFLWGQDVRALNRRAGCISSVLLNSGEELSADHYVLALGIESASIAASLGFPLAMVAAKGYSLTFSLAEASNAPTISLTEEAQKVVVSRLGKRLRVAGTAEFTGLDTSPNPGRNAALHTWVEKWFPHLGTVGEPLPWCGLRPITPSNVPYIGPSPYPNLWLNTGHGTLGWTLACGSARLLTACLCGTTDLPVDAAPYRY